MRRFEESYLAGFIRQPFYLEDFNVEALRTVADFFGQEKQLFLVLRGGVGNGKSHLLAAAWAASPGFLLTDAMCIPADSVVDENELCDHSLVILENLDLRLLRDPEGLQQTLHVLFSRFCRVIATCSGPIVNQRLPSYAEAVIAEPTAVALRRLGRRLCLSRGLEESEADLLAWSTALSVRAVDVALARRALLRAV